jgi:hypothetical protein
MNFVPIFINGSVSQITGFSSQTYSLIINLWEENHSPDDQGVGQ